MSKPCKTCAVDKVCNRETGRCVLKTGAIGRRILGSAPATSAAKPAAKSNGCPSDKVRNPTSGRCVLKTGAIGKRVIADAAAANGWQFASAAGHESTADVEAHLGRADVDGRHYDHGMTALMTASGRGKLDTVRLLLRRGAKVNLKDDDGMTALMTAALMGHIDVVRELLAAGADPTLQSLSGETASDYADENGHSDIVDLLKGGNPRIVDASFRRHPTTGLEQALPRPPRGRPPRGAPAGHAKNYKNQISRGIDGQLYISKPIATGAYRWKKYSGPV